ncbi:MAG: FecR family protein [Thermoanaerobaculia bacterium]|nr:FecR family protein [Thermoanaerobaculia bacterium]
MNESSIDPSRDPERDTVSDPLVRLLQLAEAEAPEIRPASFRRARMAVESEWLRTLRARRRRRWAVRVAVGAGLAAAATLTLWLQLPGLLGFRSDFPSEPLAELVRGSLEQAGRAAHAGASILGGAELQTSEHEGAAILLADGRSLRLAPETNLRLTGATRMELTAGALYVDSPSETEGRSLVISTPYGEARNLATQFELRVEQEALRLRVREGRVRLATPIQDVVASAGMEVEWTPGKLETQTVPLRGELWRPYVELAHFDLEGASLSEFLDWVCRETGWQLQWSDSALELRSRGVVLHGTLGGTPPHLAPDAVLPTAGLISNLADDVLQISEATAQHNDGSLP